LFQYEKQTLTLISFILGFGFLLVPNQQISFVNVFEKLYQLKVHVLPTKNVCGKRGSRTEVTVALILS
jgi:hypothetical protein